MANQSHENAQRSTDSGWWHCRWHLVGWVIALIACLSFNANALLDYSRNRDIRPLGGWDENHYYALSRSYIIDGDLDCRNDFEFLASLRGVGWISGVFQKALDESSSTATGFFPNKYGVGTAIIGGTGIIAARMLVLLYGADRVHPFASIYLLGYTWALIVAGFLGIAISWLALRALGFSPRVATSSQLLVFLGTPLGFYIWYSPQMAQASGFFALSLFVYLVLKWDRSLQISSSIRSVLPAFGMGLTLALACISRYPNAIAFLLPAVLVVVRWWRASGIERHSLFAQACVSALVAAVGFAIGCIPQLLAWKEIYGQYLLYSYTGETMHLLPRYLPEIIAGTRNSLLLWTPLVGFATLGLSLLRERHLGITYGSVVLLVAFLWIYGSWDFYWLGSSFGMRGFTDLAVVWAIGMASILHRLSESGREVQRVGITLLFASTLWGVWMVGAVRSGIQPMDQPFQGRLLLTDPLRVLQQFGSDVAVIVDFGGRKFPLITPTDFPPAHLP